MALLVGNHNHLILARKVGFLMTIQPMTDWEFDQAWTRLRDHFKGCSLSTMLLTAKGRRFKAIWCGYHGSETVYADFYSVKNAINRDVFIKSRMASNL